MAKTVFDVLAENINADIESATTFLTGGSAKDFPAYREIVGLIRGLEASKQHLAVLSRNYLEQDDD